jgi:hypothetical protein
MIPLWLAAGLVMLVAILAKYVGWDEGRRQGRSEGYNKAMVEMLNRDIELSKTRRWYRMLDGEIPYDWPPPAVGPIIRGMEPELQKVKRYE